ncbi:MAG: hypothetical protein AAFY24_11280 [Pseudomonadota bacterium]
MYNWIESTFNVSGGATQVIAAILALIAVLLLFSIFVFVLKRLTGANTPQNRSRQPRIAVMDSTNVDARRQLVLIRRDNVEHLLLVGGPSDLVVEQNIVRNAPVAAQRQPVNTVPAGAGVGAGAGAGAGSGPMKMPTAPGPDIPARPDDVERQPLAAMLRQEPVPTMPLKARAETAVRPTPKAAAPSATVRPVSPLKTEDKTPPVVPPVSPPVAKPPQEKKTVAGQDRAADLLRAATQNGFNRSTSAAQTGAEDTPAAEPAIGAAPKVRAEPEMGAAVKLKEEPEVKPAAAPDPEEASSEPDHGASAPLKSLGRSIAARERSTQMAHTITPPSSGPAARAKTALLNPVQAPRETDDSGFMFKQTNPLDEDTVDTAGGESGPDGASNPEGEKLKLSELFDNTERFNWGDDEPAGQAGADTLNEAEPVAEEAPGEKETVTSEDAAPRREIELDLELDDLIDSETPTPAPIGTAEDVSVTPVMPQPDPEVKSREPDPQPPKQTATLDIVPGADPAASRVVQGLGDKNPIEDEMAKILFELGGQQNR